MTTTGGPERSLAEPATSEQIEYPIVVDQGLGPLDGDDIVVEPDTTPPAHPRRRTRAVIVGAVVAPLVIGGVAIALANRHDAASSLRSVSPAKPAAAHPPNRLYPNPAPITPHPAGAVKPKPVITSHVATQTAPVASATAAAPPPSLPFTGPLAEPTSVLQWKANPAPISIKGGGHKTFTVTVTNPTAGTVTLPQPLSCAPVLRGPKGATFGFGVCVEMVQLMSPHQTLSHTYSIYATDSASAGGNALKAGSYTATIENLFKLNVHITAN